MTDSEIHSMSSYVYRETKKFDKLSSELQKSLITFCKVPTEENLDVIYEHIDDVLESINNIQLSLGNFI